MSGKQKVAAVRCAGYDQALIGKKLDLLMTAIGADTLIQPGMSVLIKPNLLSKFFVIKRDARTLRQTFTLRGHRVSSVLNNKLVKALQDTLSMFSSE